MICRIQDAADNGYSWREAVVSAALQDVPSVKRRPNLYPK